MLRGAPARARRAHRGPSARRRAPGSRARWHLQGGERLLAAPALRRRGVERHVLVQGAAGLRRAAARLSRARRPRAARAPCGARAECPRLGRAAVLARCAARRPRSTRGGGGGRRRRRRGARLSTREEEDAGARRPRSRAARGWWRRAAPALAMCPLLQLHVPHTVKLQARARGWLARRRWREAVGARIAPQAAAPPPPSPPPSPPPP